MCQYTELCVYRSNNCARVHAQSSRQLPFSFIGLTRVCCARIARSFLSSLREHFYFWLVSRAPTTAGALNDFLIVGRCPWIKTEVANWRPLLSPHSSDR